MRQANHTGVSPTFMQTLMAATSPDNLWICPATQYNLRSPLRQRDQFFALAKVITGKCNSTPDLRQSRSDSTRRIRPEVFFSCWLLTTDKDAHKSEGTHCSKQTTIAAHRRKRLATPAELAIQVHQQPYLYLQKVNLLPGLLYYL